MGAVALWARADLRRRWPSAVVLTLLIGIVGCVVLAGFAGARRTSSSYERFVSESRASDVFVFPGTPTPSRVRDFAGAPFIEAVASARVLQVELDDGDQPPTGVPLDDRFGRVVERSRIIAGRAANPDVADEIVLPEPLAQERDLQVGDTLRLHSYTPAQVDGLRSGAFDQFPEPAGPTVGLEVVGISRLPSDLSLSGALGGILVTTPAFGERYTSEIGSYAGDVLSVRLRHGAADVPKLSRRASAFFGDADVFDIQPLGESFAGVQQSIDLLSLGAVLFAGIVAVAGLTAIGLALRRRIDGGAAEQETLRSLGLTRSGRSMAVGLPVAPSVVLGALLGVGGAWLASPLMPMGLARKAEPDPGLDFDPLVLGVGAAVLVAALVVLVAVVSWRIARVRPGDDAVASRVTVVARASESVGAAPSASIGVRTALEARGRTTGVPVRSALIGTIAAVLGVSVMLVVGGSLDHLVRTPALYGFNWDARVVDGSLTPTRPDRPCTVERSRLTDVDGVGDVASVCTLNIELEGRPIAAFGLTSIRGEIEPTIVEGRAPRTSSEVAIGSTTRADLGRGIGDSVRVEGARGPVDYQIVGIAAAPRFDDEFANAAPVADGAFFTGAGLDAVDDPADEDYDVDVLIRVAPGADRDAVLRRVERLPEVARFDGGPGVGRAMTPIEVQRLEQLDRLPLILASFLGVLGILSVGFALVASVRGRGRELAILKTLGFSRRQVSSTVAWQATTMAVVGIAVGLPLGVAVGRAIWRAIGADIGVAAAPEVALGLLALVGLVTLVLANLIAAVPAALAARTNPAARLRSE